MCLEKKAGSELAQCLLTLELVNRHISLYVSFIIGLYIGMNRDPSSVALPDIPSFLSLLKIIFGIRTVSLMVECII